MSFSWKGLLGVNSSSSLSSSQSATHSPLSSSNTSQPSTASAASSYATSAVGNPAAAGKSTANGSHYGGGGGGGSTVGAFGGAVAASIPSVPSSRALYNPNPYALNHQAPPQQVSFFGGMVTPIASASLGSPGGVGSFGAVAPPRKPLEVPVNTVEGGGPLLGMENFGNTCYVNSMLQALYFCRPFRESLLSYQPPRRSSTDGLLAAVPKSPTPAAAAGDDVTPTEDAAANADGNWELDALMREGIPPPDTLFAALRDLFDVIAQAPRSMQTASVVSTTTPTSGTFAPGSLTSPSPLSAASTAAGGSGGNGSTAGGASSMMRKASTLGRPSTAGATSGRGGIGSHAASGSGAASAGAVNIVPGSSAGQGQAALSISTANVNGNANGSAGGAEMGFAVDSSAVKAFIGTLKRENVLFDSTMHQDAHEMLNFVLNKVGEDLVDADRARRARKQRQQLEAETQALNGHAPPSVVREVGPNGSTCVHRLFEGVLTNETRCLTCETVTSRDEAFLDLSIDIEHNASVSSCLRQFSASEMLRSRNKFFCDSCSGLQEAEKRMKVRKLPNVLALHLKRFKYEESIQRYVKLAYRVAFPLELRLFNTSDDADDPDRLYKLSAIVVHIGAGPHHGHYIAIVKVGQRWVLFDDDSVTYIDECEISKYYGDRPGIGSAYVLFYQAVDLDFESLGLDQPLDVPSADVVDPMAGSTANGGGGGSDDARWHFRDESGPIGSGGGGLTTVPEVAGGVPSTTGSRHFRLTSAPAPAAASMSTSATHQGIATAGSAATFNGSDPSGGAGASEAANANGSSGGWFDSLRSRGGRAGSQSMRRPKTMSTVETHGSMNAGVHSVPVHVPGEASAGPGSSTSGSTAPTPRHHAMTLGSATPETMTTSTSTLSSIASTPYHTVEPLSPMTKEPASITGSQDQEAFPTSTSGSSGFERTPPIAAAVVAAKAAAATSSAKAHEQRLQREENMARAQLNRNRRMRAASESVVPSHAMAHSPINAEAMGGVSKLRSSPLTEEASLPRPTTPSQHHRHHQHDASAYPATDASTTAAASHSPLQQKSLHQAQQAAADSQRLSQVSLPGTTGIAAAGAAFAPADRPISKKEQKAIARTSRRGSSGLDLGSMSIPGFGGGSSLVHAATVAGGEHGGASGAITPSKSGNGMFSNIFGEDSSSSTGTGSPYTDSVAATPEEAATPGSVVTSSTTNERGDRSHPTRKSSISTRSLSRTFGFGRSKGT